MTLEEGADVVIRFRAGWELRGELRIVGSAGVCIFDPALKEKVWVQRMKSPTSVTYPKPVGYRARLLSKDGTSQR